jgi:hypothetical protein
MDNCQQPFWDRIHVQLTLNMASFSAKISSLVPSGHTHLHTSDFIATDTGDGSSGAAGSGSGSGFNGDQALILGNTQGTGPSGPLGGGSEQGGTAYEDVQGDDNGEPDLSISGSRRLLSW